MKSLLIPVLLLTALFCIPVKTQEKADASAPSGLVLEVIYFKGRPTAYQMIPEPGAKGESWYALFQRVADPRPDAASFPVRSVNIAPRLEDNLVKVRVSVFTGLKSREKEEFVADYTIRENEKIIVAELAKFGVEPFQIAAVRNTPSVSDLPTVVNKTNSLQVNVEPNYSTLPSYKLKLINSSSKAIIAFSLEEMVDNRVNISGIPHGRRGEFLIAPGETYEKIFKSSFVLKTYDKEIIAAQPNREIVISSAVFEDGSYEGDARKAAQFLAFALGRKSQLQKIIPLLESAASNSSDLNDLHKQISNLNLEPDEIAFSEYVKKFPNMTDREKIVMRNSARSVARDVGKTTLDDLAAFIETHKNGKINNEWLVKTKKSYQEWLARLP